MPVIAIALGWAFTLAPIDWHAPASCPDAAEVERRARSLGPGLAPKSMVGEVTIAADGTFVLDLAIDGAPSRRYVAHDCEALANVAALVLAVAVDPVAVAATRTEVPAAVGDIPPTAAPVVLPSPAVSTSPNIAVTRPASPRRSPPPLEGFARVHGVFGIGELPRFDAGLGVALGIGAGHGRFELHGTYLFARSAALPGVGEAEAVIASWNLSPRGCGLLGRRSVRATLCAGPEVGIVTASGRHLRQVDDTVAVWIAAVGAPGIEWAILPWLRLHAGVELVAGIRRPQFAARERPDDRITLGAGGLRVMLGIAGHFGPGARGGPSR
jgi:hypothetical protein